MTSTTESSPAAGLRTRALLTTTLLLSLGRTGAAQSPAPRSDPASAVQAFWKAVLAMRWADAVEYLDLTDLEATRRLQVQGARMPRGREYTVEDLMRRDPEMPREAAEYQIKQREKMRRQYPPRLFPFYFGVDSASQMERMPIEEVAVRWLQGHDPLWMMQELRRTSRCPPTPALDSLAAARRPLVYGAVMAGSDTAYVLFRPVWMPIETVPAGAFEGMDFQPLRIATLKRTPEGWLIRATESLLEGVGGMWGMEDCKPRP